MTYTEVARWLTACGTPFYAFGPNVVCWPMVDFEPVYR